MSLTRLWSLLPSKRVFLTVVASSLAGAVLTVAVSTWAQRLGESAPNPALPHDPKFVALGKDHLPQLGKAYAAAWEEGAKHLEAGKGVAAALDVVAKTWSSKRTQLYDQMFTPHFSRIVPESAKDEEVKQADRAALAAAWRGLALGLGK
jgi:hypothetical protein